MQYFCDEPDHIRMTARAIVQDGGGYVCGYYGPHLQVALPNTGTDALCYQLAWLGLRRQNAFYFPADTGSPKHLIHRRGYWLHVNFTREGGGRC
jgi:hypothetical protein